MKRFKDILYKVVHIVVLALLFTALTSCSDDEVESPAKEKQEWTMTIPAVMSGPTHADARLEDYIQPVFGPDDRIYVYNTTRHVLLSGSLKPQTIGQTTTTLVQDGTLTGEVEGNDVLKLYYLPQNWNSKMMIKECFHGGNPWWRRRPGINDHDNPIPRTQTGLADDISHYAFAIGEVKVWGVRTGDIRTFETQVTFTQQQSFFRLAFQFEDQEGNPVDASTIDLSNEEMCRMHVWTDNTEAYNFHPGTLSGELWLAIGVYPNMESVTFVMCDQSNRLFRGSLTMPENEMFQKGKIYNSDEPVVLKQSDSMYY